MNLPTAFHYHEGYSALHRADPRAKSAAFIAFNIALVAATPPGLVLLLALVAAGYAAAGESLLRPVIEGWLLLLLAGFVVLSRSFSGAGLPAGIEFAARMLLALLGAHLYSRTTSLRAVRHVLRWALNPVSERTAERLSAMITMSMAFVPVFFDAARKVQDGIAARGLNSRRHPFRYLRHLTIGLLHAVVGDAVELSAAMECRAFDPAADPPDFRKAVPNALFSAGSMGCLAAIAGAALALFL